MERLYLQKSYANMATPRKLSATPILIYACLIVQIPNFLDKSGILLIKVELSSQD
ncbi:hypothetical protein QHH11_00610 [Aphanizomenon sp. PH219]|nr:hypothetical protein [Aphanizomenon sp. 202]MDK2457655.1 hypothetical protein [Aphanizomenon sp. PH219]